MNAIKYRVLRCAKQLAEIRIREVANATITERVTMDMTGCSANTMLRPFELSPLPIKCVMTRKTLLL
jgi:hypothetical protein